MINDKINDFFRKHSDFCLLSGIFLLSLVLRILYYILTDRIARDSFFYIKCAELLYESNWDWSVVYTKDLMKNVPPLLTAVMTAGKEIGIGVKASGILFCMICGSLLPLGVYFCSVNIFKKRIYAYFAALLIAFHPYSIEVSANILREASALCFFSFALASAIYAVNTGQKRFWVLFAVLSGLTALTRKEGVELLLIFFVWNLIAIIKNKQPFRKRFTELVKNLVIVIFFFCFITLPVWFFIRSTTNSTWSLFPFGDKILEYCQ